MLELLRFEVGKRYKILIKKLSATKYIELKIQNIEAEGIDDPIIKYVLENILTNFY